MLKLILRTAILYVVESIPEIAHEVAKGYFWGIGFSIAVLSVLSFLSDLF